VVSLAEEIRDRIQKTEYRTQTNLIPTFFEFVTAMAFLYFSRNNVDWAVIEVGMGGRLDATNVITPAVSVITNISYDHKEFLGDTLTDIAREKAGIIKKGIPVVSAQQEKEAEEVIVVTAKERSSPLFIYGRDFSGKLKSSSLEGITFDYLDDPGSIAGLHTPLAGEHQLFNACLAVKAAMVALKSAEEQQSKRAAEQHKNKKASALLRFCASALKSGLSNTQWRGRLEIVSNDPVIMIDGAHNPEAANTLARFAKEHLSNYKIILIMGIMSDKDIGGIMSPLLPIASEIIFTAPDYGRAASPQKLAEIALHMGFSSKVANSVRDAIETAKELVRSQKSEVRSQKADGTGINKTLTPDSGLLTHDSRLILITGSLYTIGEALEMLGKKAVLGTLREMV
jgi:dihydrofolate synthase/folylpolyglutamate synthase